MILQLQWLLFMIVLVRGEESRTFFNSEPLNARHGPGPEKNYTGFRVLKDSYLIIYYHDQTLAVVELGDGQQLLNCELLEVKTPSDRKVTLNRFHYVRVKVRISFKDMRDLMTQCGKLDTPANLPKRFISKSSQDKPPSIFRLIFPGTKWCGKGDIALSYFDLGENTAIDRCCRTHDLCPVKVRGYTSMYNITNTSMYTRSHCLCDKDFQKCLHAANSSSAHLIETVYFGYSDVVCIDDDKSKAAKVLRMIKLRM